MNDKQKKLTHKKVKTKTSVDIIHKMREIVNLAKLMRHFMGLWTVQHLKPRHTVTSQHSPLLGRSVRDPAASLFQAPRWSDPRNWGSAETKKREETFFPPRPPFRVFDTPTRLPHYLRAWNRLPSCDVKCSRGDFAGYNTCCWNIFGKRVMFSITVGIISPLNWQSSHRMY